MGPEDLGLLGDSLQPVPGKGEPHRAAGPSASHFSAWAHSLLQRPLALTAPRRLREDLSLDAETQHGRCPNALSGLLKYQFCTWLHTAARGPAQAHYLILLSLRNPISNSSGIGGGGGQGCLIDLEPSANCGSSDLRGNEGNQAGSSLHGEPTLAGVRALCPFQHLPSLGDRCCPAIAPGKGPAWSGDTAVLAAPPLGNLDSKCHPGVPTGHPWSDGDFAWTAHPAL